MALQKYWCQRDGAEHVVDETAPAPALCRVCGQGSFVVGLNQRRTTTPDRGNYSRVVLADAPVAYWQMTEASGNITDLVGGLIGTANGTPTYGAAGPIAGVAGTAITFDGSSAYFSVPDSASLRIVGDLTVEFWINGSGAAGQLQSVIFKGSLNTSGPFSVRTQNVAPPAKMLFLRGNGSVEAPSAPTLAIPTSGWQYVVYTQAGTTAMKYLAGAPNGSGTLNTTTTDSGNPLLIGATNSAAPGRFLAAALGHLAIYNYGLSAAQVAAHYFAGVGAINPGA